MLMDMEGVLSKDMTTVGKYLCPIAL